MGNWGHMILWTEDEKLRLVYVFRIYTLNISSKTSFGDLLKIWKITSFSASNDELLWEIIQER